MAKKDNLNKIKTVVKRHLNEFFNSDIKVSTSVKSKVEQGATDVIKFSLGLEDKDADNDLLVYVNRQDNSLLRLSSNIGADFLRDFTNSMLNPEFVAQFEKTKIAIKNIVYRYLLADNFLIDDTQLFSLNRASSKAYSGQYTYHQQRTLCQTRMNKNIYEMTNNYVILKSDIKFKYDGQKIFAYPSLQLSLGSNKFVIDFNTTSHFGKKLDNFIQSILSLIDGHFYKALKRIFDLDEDNARMMKEQELDSYIDILYMSKI